MATGDPRGDGTGAVATGGGTEPMARPAAVHPNASSHTRPDVPPMLPLVGAVVAGALAALVALVTKGLTAALIVVTITLAVQQLEGHLLAPLLLGRAVSLHPVVIILALAAGSILGGIIGAFLAVPIAAVVTAVGTYLRGEPVGEPADQQQPEPKTSGRHAL